MRSLESRRKKAAYQQKYMQEWWKANPKAVAAHKRKHKLKSQYGMSLAEYDALLKAQDSGCAICGMSPEDNGVRLCVDHDHNTGEIRGLLCRKCNAALGLADDSIERLLNLATYLTKWKRG